MKRPPIRNDLTAEFVRSILSYDPISGVLTWKVNRSQGTKAGSIAGCRTVHGYIDIMIKGRTYKAHRLGWLITHGVWPTEELDHRDGNRSNNPLSNLREATRGQNNLNRETKGFSSFFPRKSPKKYRAAIGTQGKDLTILGWFMTAEEAKAVSRAAAQERYGDFSFAHRSRSEERDA